MPNIKALGAALDIPVRQHCEDRASIRRQMQHQRATTDFLYELSLMRENPRYRFAGGVLEGIYTTVDHSGRVSEGQRRAVNNIRHGCGDAPL